MTAKNIYRFIFLLIAMISLLIRLNQLGQDEVWLDEAFTGFLSLNSEWYKYLVGDNSPPLFYIIQRTICSLSTCNEYILRLPSVIYGLIFIRNL